MAQKRWIPSNEENARRCRTRAGSSHDLASFGTRTTIPCARRGSGRGTAPNLFRLRTLEVLHLTRTVSHRGGRHWPAGPPKAGHHTEVKRASELFVKACAFGLECIVAKWKAGH